MQVKLSQLPLTHIKNEKLFEFLTQYEIWVGDFEFIKTKIEPMFVGVFIPLFRKFDDGIKKIRGSEYTLNIRKLDGRRDNAWLSMLDMLKSAQRHPDQNIVASAHKISVAIKDYRSLHKKEYNAETGSIRNVLQELNGRCKLDVEKVGLTVLVKELEEANNEFAEFVDMRTSQKSEQSNVDVKAVKKDITDIYNTMIDYLNGCVYIDGYDKYEIAFRKLNAIIDSYREPAAKKPAAIIKDEDKPIIEGEKPPVEEEKPPVVEEKYPNAKEWTEMVDVGDFKNGDICFVVIDGVKKYYEMIDETSFDVKPHGDEGSIAWKPIE